MIGGSARCYFYGRHVRSTIAAKPPNYSLFPLFRLRSPAPPFAAARRGFHASPLPHSPVLPVDAEGPSTSSDTFMDYVKTVLGHASAVQERAAVRADSRSYGYGQLVASAFNISKLLADADLKSVNNDTSLLDGARVGIVAKPSAEFVAGVLGTWIHGGIAVPLALSYPEAELLHVMKDADISMILSTREHQQLMGTVAAECSAQISLIPDVASMTSHDNSNSHPGEDATNSLTELIIEIEDSKKIEGENPALILYTSGTTGKPKGVVHTHKGIIAQVQILTEAWEYTSKDQFLHCLPLHHVHGLFNALLAPLYAGSVVEFLPKFSVRGIWQRWCDSYPVDGSETADAITAFTGVPTIYARLLQGYEAMDPTLQSACASAASKLRLVMCGSSALPYPVMKQWEEVTGHRLLERYGMTEFVMALSNPLHGNRKPGTVGKPLPRVEVKIVSDDNAEEGAGELCVRSPSMFKEYWKQPKVTEESFIEGGFFKTGDSVTVDADGHYIMLGRTNADIMKVGGYKLSALEIEAILLEHEIAAECCVLGLPDKDYGEVVCAILVPIEEAKKKADSELKPAITLEELQTWAKERLAPYKIPTKLYVWDELPRNAMGKVNKKELKTLLTNQS